MLEGISGALTREELEALSRKEIQQLAIKANLKANQKTAALIDALLSTHARPTQGKETAERRVSLGDVSNRAKPASICERQQRAGAEEDLSQQLARCSLSAPEATHADLGGTRPGLNATVDPYWEDDDGELEAIRETLAQLLELGFSEEEAQWAVDEAKKKRKSSQCESVAAPAGLGESSLDSRNNPDADEAPGAESHSRRWHGASQAAESQGAQAAGAAHQVDEVASILDALSLKEACPHSIATGREQLSTLAPAASAEPALSGALAVGGGGGRDDAQSLGEEETGQVLGAVLGRVLAYLDIWSLTCKVHLVSKAWQRAVVECLVRRPDAVQDVGEEGEVCEGRGAVAAMSVPLPAMNLPALRRKFPWARFLAEGGFKKVYLVWNQEADRTEALSVMDMAAMRESGNEAVADSEVRLSFLLSRLVEHGACKHFVRVYQLLRCATAPPPDWGDQGNKQPMGSLSCFRKARVCTHAAESKACSRGRAAAAAKLQAQRGDFVYIRMELCDGGDLEEALREHPRPRARVVAQLVRQMALSLLSAQKELHMRHYDVKLLNFFLKSQPRCSPAAGARPADAATDGEDVGATDEFWERRDMEWVVKLADYGTAETDVASMGGALQERHVTTWENLLPAMLIWGDRALQGYDSDVHALGLCMLHLCTGDAPYEETVAALRCPRALADAWRSIWLKGCHSKTSKTASKHARDWKRRYASAAELLRTADDDEVLLQDTLYRNLVLFAPEVVEQRQGQAAQEASGSASCSSPVLDAIREYVRGGDGSEAWRQDVAVYSLMTTSASKCSHIARAQHVLSEIPRGMELIQGMVTLRPSPWQEEQGAGAGTLGHRLSMHDIVALL